MIQDTINLKNEEIVDKYEHEMLSEEFENLVAAFLRRAVKSSDYQTRNEFVRIVKPNE